MRCLSARYRKAWNLITYAGFVTALRLPHLEPVTGRVNQLRGNTFAAANAAKTHCDAGHEYDLLNTYWKANGARGCRKCRTDARRRHEARKKDARTGIRIDPERQP